MRLFYAFIIHYIMMQVYAQDTDRYLEFKVIKTNNDNDSINWPQSDKINREFLLNGKVPVRCRLSIIDSTHIDFSQYQQNKWQLIDILEYSILPGDDGFITPSFEITDFNTDGNEDFIYWSHTNMNGNE